MAQWERGRHRACWALLALLAAVAPASSGSFSKSARGTTGAQFLELPASARAAAMGSAQGAAVLDVTALDYNPAALASIEGGDAVFMHAEHFEGISYDYLAAARRFGDAGTLALGLRSLSPGTIPEMDNTGLATGGSLSPRDLALSLGYGRTFGNIELGSTGKYISSKIDESASAFALDLGARYRRGPWAFSGGVANVGMGLKFRDRSDPLPLTIRLGSSYDWSPNVWRHWVFALDLVAPRGTMPHPALGAEYRHRISERFVASGRLGYDGRLSQSRLGGMTGIAFGVGVEVGRARFDYATSSFGDLGMTHRLSAGLAWGGASGSKKTERRVESARTSGGNAQQPESSQTLAPTTVAPPAAPVPEAPKPVETAVVPATPAPGKQGPAQVSAELQAKVSAGADLVNRVRSEIGKVIVGQEEMVDSLLIAMISGEHVLLEGVPGVAKTTTVKAFAGATEAEFQRIQGTPDKLPSDILGAEILQDNPVTGIKTLKLEKGPVVTHILLVDEINRLIPKTQAALLDAMQERRITIGRNTIEIPEPFIVLATQNPIEQEGTYRLSAAQQDRFMLKVIVDRPSREQILEIMTRFASREKSPKASKITTLTEFAAAGKVAGDIYASPEIQGTIANIVEATNDPTAFGLDLKRTIANGASPRAAIYLLKAARVHAFLQGRAEVNRSDIFAMAPMILRHRIMLSHESPASKLTVEQVIQKILETNQVWQGASTK